MDRRAADPADSEPHLGALESLVRHQPGDPDKLGDVDPCEVLVDAGGAEGGKDDDHSADEHIQACSAASAVSDEEHDTAPAQHREDRPIGGVDLQGVHWRQPTCGIARQRGGPEDEERDAERL